MKKRLLTILLLIPINVMAANEPQKRLNIGEKAPYTGVLVPDDLFRHYQITDFEQALLKNRAEQCETAMTELKPETNWVAPLSFVGGLVLGIYLTKLK